MRGIQLLVTVMTVLIFIGMALLVYGFATKGAQLNKSMAAPPKEVVLPLSAKIESMASWGDGVALHVTAPKGEFIVLVTPTGSVRARIPIKRSADADKPAQ